MVDRAGMKRSDEANHDVALSADQKAAVAGLAAPNVYAEQSMWTTLRGLHGRQRWMFFVEHFLLGLVAVVVTIGVVAAVVVTYVTKPPDPVFAIQGFGMTRDAEGLKALGRDFARHEHIWDDRLVEVNASADISGGYGDSSPQILARVSAGQINMMVADRKTFVQLVRRGLVSAPGEVLDHDELVTLAKQGALLDKNGRQADDPAGARGLRLANSIVWGERRLPREAVLMFANVQSGTKYPRDFVNYLYFKGTRMP
ncbi:hypothetical protein GA0061078_1399 [Bifidobacterium bohemicum]|nr:hypothetical protein GA0061078_1399 [Bifidobacterium bohemicum]